MRENVHAEEDGKSMRPGARLWTYSALLALAALLCGVLLGGLSAWFLGSVALAGMTAAALTFNFHIPGALVRLFAIGRTVARYGERLVGHKAALDDQVTRRVRIFRGMADAPGVRRSGWQLGDQARLTDYLDDVESLDFGRLRVGLPVLTIGTGLAAGVAGTIFVAPLALLPILAVLAMLYGVGYRLVALGDEALSESRRLRQDAARRVGMALAALVALHAERAWRAECTAAIAPFSQADRALLTVRRCQAAFDALAALVGPVAAISVIGFAWSGGVRGEALLLPVFVAFAWFALAESQQGASRILIAHLRRRTAAQEVAIWTGPAAETGQGAPAAKPARLDLVGFQPRSPDGRALGAPVTLTLQVGRPVILAGPSGVGKTSLLKQIAGWIGEDVIGSDAENLSPARRRALTSVCLHDAAILSDSVRANLFAPGRSDAEIRSALVAVEMEDRVGLAGGPDGWVTQELVSLGEAQRLNLARAWLSFRPIIVLDEPTEHLDDAQSARILARLLDRLRDRIVVMSSHRAHDVTSGVVVVLGGHVGEVPPPVGKSTS